MRVQGKLWAAVYLLRSWARAMPRIAYRSTLSLAIDPKGAQRFIHQVLNAQDLESHDKVLGSVDLLDLVQSDADPKIVGSYHCRKDSDTRRLLELASLAYLMQVLEPEVIFEIGTYVGRTTRLLALNCLDTTCVFTLDLPRECVSHDVGEAYRGTPESKRITQLYGDSARFDFSPWYGRCDFVWVDGCHDYSYVLRDSQQAMSLCRPGGWIAWHDYRHTAWWSGVTRGVRELARRYPGIRHLRETTIAVFRMPGGRTLPSGSSLKGTPACTRRNLANCCFDLNSGWQDAYWEPGP